MPFSPKRAGSVAYSLVMFLIVSVLAGVLIAGLFVPIAGVAGVGSKAAAAELDSIPAELATPAPATRSKVLMGNGKVLAYFYDENRIPVKLSDIAPVMRQAQIAIEDHRFYEHGALDIKGTLRALIRNSTGDGSVQGGSSITQQYVKMVQIEACQAKGDAQCVRDAQAPTVERKIRELRYAIALEKRLTKDQILERYLNIAYYGEGAYGVEAAARHYYSTHADKLTLPQAAMLAGLVQNPDNVNPVSNRSAALERRDVVLNRMVELSLITADQAKKAKTTGFDESQVKPTRNGCVGSRYPFLCDYVRRTLLLTPSLGKNVEERDNLIKRGGLTIQTAIDPKSQNIAQRAVSNIVGPKDPLIATMNMIEPGTGLIIASAQSRPVMGTRKKKGQTYYNYSVDQALGGAEGYQAGSTFKVFTAAAALEKGIPLSKKYNAQSPMYMGNWSFSTCIGRARDPKYRPKNSTGVNGVMDMYKGIAMSVNTYFLQLEHDIGVCPATKMAKKMGVQLSDPNLDLTSSPTVQVPSFTLGVSEVTPMSMAEAYATFAARGIHCKPVIVSKITMRSGRLLEPPDADCKRVMSKDVADGMNKLLRRVMQNSGNGFGAGTGFRARVAGYANQAGKTGTVNSNKAVWFNGYTPLIAGSAMIAVDPTRKIWQRSRARSGVLNYRVPSTDVVLEGSGSGDAGMKIWKPAMTKAMEGKPDVRFKEPPDSILEGKQVRIPDLSGIGYAAGKDKLEELGFTVIRRTAYSDVYPRGTFMGFSPGSGAEVPEFSDVYAVFSGGRDPQQINAEQRAREAEARRQAEAEARRDQAEAEARRQAEEEQRQAEEEARRENRGNNNNPPGRR
jgi:membrane peptidoglycan carboxypeptidase